MKELKIRITGSGDKYMLSQALIELGKIVANTLTSKLENGVEWEDGILLTEITLKEE